MKARDSEKVDSESKGQAESAKTLDSKKQYLESPLFTSLDSNTSSISLSQKEKGFIPSPLPLTPKRIKPPLFLFGNQGECLANPLLAKNRRRDTTARLVSDFWTPRSGRDNESLRASLSAPIDFIAVERCSTAESSEPLEVACLSACNEGKHTAESHNEDKTESSTMFAPQIQLIISNPPYIARDYPISAPLRYEPAIALFSGEDGLDMLRELIIEASRRGVWLLCEIGYDQRECLEQILEQSGAKEWRFYKDLSGFWRGFVARF